MPGKSEKVKDGKDGHFDAEEKRRDTDPEVRALEALGGFDGAAGCEERDEDGLPE